MSNLTRVEFTLNFTFIPLVSTDADLRTSQNLIISLELVYSAIVDRLQHISMLPIAVTVLCCRDKRRLL